MAYSLINTDSAAQQGGSHTSLATPGKSHTTGNLLVVVMACDNAEHVTSVTDTAGNTYTLCSGSREAGATGAFQTEIWYAYNITGNASNVVTMTLNATSSHLYIGVLQYSGSSTTDPLETTVATFSQSGGTVTSSSFSPAASGNLNVVGMTNNNESATYTAGSGYTLELTIVGTLGIEDNPSAASGSQTAAFTASQGNQFNMSVASFKLPGGTPPTVNSNFFFFMPT